MPRGLVRLDQKLGPMKIRIEAILRSISGLLPAAAAAYGGASTALASHDDGVVRTIGAGSTGIFRALDLLVAAPALLLPIGTRAFRAGLAPAVLTGICGVLAFDLARGLVGAAVPTLLKNMSGRASERLMAAVSAVAVLSALLSPVWQTEATQPGGAVTGALLVLLAMRFSELPALGVILGAAASYDPFTFVATLAAAGPALVKQRHAGRAELLHTVALFVVGLLPLALGFAVSRRAPEITLPHGAFDIGAAVSPYAFLTTELGIVLLVAGVAGIALSSTKPAAVPLILTVLAGIAALLMHVAAGPNRYGAAILAGILAFYILMAVALAVVVLAIARARVPFAEASAALVVVLELVLPVRAADDSFARAHGRAAHAAALWNDVAWGPIAPAGILLVHDRETMGRIASARAVGDFRADLVVVPAYDVQGRAGEHALLDEPKLAALYRDMALDVPPEELSLTQLDAARPVYANFDPKWDRALARHLVPVGLTARFEPEPRGASDRMRALEALASAKDHLMAITRKDPELTAATVRLLRHRAVGMGATGEREVLAKALDDLRAFSPDDPIGTTLTRRLVTTKGAIDVRDLKPF